MTDEAMPFQDKDYTDEQCHDFVRMTSSGRREFYADCLKIMDGNLDPTFEDLLLQKDRFNHMSKAQLSEAIFVALLENTDVGFQRLQEQFVRSVMDLSKPDLNGFPRDYSAQDIQIAMNMLGEIQANGLAYAPAEAPVIVQPY